MLSATSSHGLTCSGWSLEGVHLAPRRIDFRHHMLDGSIFAGCVHRLKNQKECPLLLRIEHVLPSSQVLNASLQVGRGVSLRLDSARILGVEVLEAKCLPSSTR